MAAGKETLGIADLAAATPASRDRYVDFLRAVSILVVVVGHWTIALIFWDSGVIRSTSAIGKTPGLWMATWLFQVMPVFFFVGGYSNYVAYQSALRRGDSPTTFIRSRLRRLLVPSAVLMAVWAVIQVVLHVTDTGAPTGPRIGDLVLLRGVRPPGQTIPFGPLWFLGVYLVVVCISPLTVALHRRFRWWVPAIMVAGTVIADAVGFIGGHGRVRYLNAVFVFLLPHQLGHFYGDGSVDRWSRAALAAMAAVGLGGLVLLTNPWLFEALGGDRRFEWFPGIGHYPRSLLGTDLEKVANTYPPTVCFMLVGFWLIALVLLLRPAFSRWLQRPGAWRATILGNAWIMTLFLWHMTAYLAAILLLWPLGFGHEHEPTARWWLERPIWIAVPGALLVGLIALFGRFEAQGHRRARPTA
ncbi:MAG TPA: acyltransferase [Acidimicrobiia bacterium]|jgi:fucose 4-O-acetylase-like acetyltransferase|nr:acyltransferase [Acidimicrobiia bacterium]